MAKLRPFTMPKWGIEMSEGTVAEWMVAENQPFAKGTVLTLIETDKITNEVEAEADGCFVRLIAEAGQTYPVGALLAVLSDGGEASAEEVEAVIAGFRAVDARFDGSEQGVAMPPPAIERVREIPDGLAISPVAREKTQAAGLDVADLHGSGRGGRITAQDVDQALRPSVSPHLVGVLPSSPPSSCFATPMARRLSALHGVPLEGLTGSGPRGRIRKADVLAAIPAAAAVVPSSGGVEIIPMSSMRRTIARRLTEAKQTIPHFYVRRRVRADRLLALRAAAAGEQRPSVNDYLIRACALALMEVPQLNIQVQGQDIHRFASADIAVAVATERGLVTPIVTRADDRPVAEIRGVMAALIRKAKAGKLRPEEFSGGSFSLSNLGGFGVEQFDAIINPPQGAILAVGAARPEPIDDEGAIRVVPVLHLSLSCDHRAIDGADAGRFMAALAALIERPELL
ncbi:2-oxo acid dehydrogenase subunit E2 [Sphingomonas oligoaromativorans]|uniref:2-oxo acid dehydrogenase subunit E2 n=1 Tax=Sphingomonas oligoaromativorans TaxID=575322 RepID=UPI00141F5AD6|nr:2-oxo acid dehydrogenase subunit E2 [Sphingomonas oligoaromativorans]NIJ33263.1 pyruvate dehydrogenase E2 component (dihydrolipoamide acetyltransferase) [Sphingomonas oligoaromativorans]